MTTGKTDSSAPFVAGLVAVLLVAPQTAHAGDSLLLLKADTYAVTGEAMDLPPQSLFSSRCKLTKRFGAELDAQDPDTQQFALTDYLNRRIRKTSILTARTGIVEGCLGGYLGLDIFEVFDGGEVVGTVVVRTHGWADLSISPPEAVPCGTGDLSPLANVVPDDTPVFFWLTWRYTDSEVVCTDGVFEGMTGSATAEGALWVDPNGEGQHGLTAISLTAD